MSFFDPRTLLALISAAVTFGALVLWVAERRQFSGGTRIRTDAGGNAPVLRPAARDPLAGSLFLVSLVIFGAPADFDFRIDYRVRVINWLIAAACFASAWV